MIAKRLQAQLRKRFPDRGMIEGEFPDPIAVFPAHHPAVGKLEIHVDGEEAIVVIEHIAHGHFNSYDNQISDDERAQIIAEDVCEFVEDLFENRILLHKTPSGRIGGWLQIESDTGRRKSEHLYFTWAGPVDA